MGQTRRLRVYNMNTHNGNGHLSEGANKAEARVAVVYRPIAELKPHPNNPRLHSPRQIRQIARSIEAFGFNVPVLVDAQLKVIAGHGRFSAHREPGWIEVPTMRPEH